jgi:hypothetical protein
MYFENLILASLMLNLLFQLASTKKYSAFQLLVKPFSFYKILKINNTNLTIPWNGRVTVAVFNHLLSTTFSFSRAPHGGRSAKKRELFKTFSKRMVVLNVLKYNQSDLALYR